MKGKKAVSRRKSAWLLNLGLMFTYSLFIVGCFFIFILPIVWGSRPTVWSGLASVFLVMLISTCISYALYNLRRTLMIFLSSSLLGFFLTSAASVALLFHSYTTYSIEDDTVTISPVHQIGEFVIGVFFFSILGAIAGSFIAEKTRKGEKRLTLRCYSCGTWNEEDAVMCSYCGKKLNSGTPRSEEEKIL